MVESVAHRFARISTAERPTDTKILMRRAIVLGASMAGLMAARVLSDHAEEGHHHARPSERARPAPDIAPGLSPDAPA